jgi:hypothetical protein
MLLPRETIEIFWEVVLDWSLVMLWFGSQEGERTKRSHLGRKPSKGGR